MKKVVSLVTIFVLCLTALAGCSGSKEVDLKTVLSDINSKLLCSKICNSLHHIAIPSLFTL